MHTYSALLSYSGRRREIKSRIDPSSLLITPAHGLVICDLSEASRHDPPH